MNRHTIIAEKYWNDHYNIKARIVLPKQFCCDYCDGHIDYVDSQGRRYCKTHFESEFMITLETKSEDK